MGELRGRHYWTPIEEPPPMPRGIGTVLTLLLAFTGAMAGVGALWALYGGFQLLVISVVVGVPQVFVTRWVLRRSVYLTKSAQGMVSVACIVGYAGLVAVGLTLFPIPILVS